MSVALDDVVCYGDGIQGMSRIDQYKYIIEKEKTSTDFAPHRVKLNEISCSWWLKIWQDIFVYDEATDIHI